MKPVVLVPDATLLAVVIAGAVRAGRAPTMTIVREAAELASVIELGTDGELVIVSLADLSHMTEAAIGLAKGLVGLGARPIPVLVAGLDAGVEPRCLAWLHQLPSGLNVAVPSMNDDRERRRLWDSLRAQGLDERHHLVEVDGQPALDEMAAHHVLVEGDVVRLLAAGAAGVLSGRMVSGDRRWAAAIED
jgi:sulfur carrier protein ThiS